MRKKKHDLDLDLSRLQHLNMLDEQTDLQVIPCLKDCSRILLKILITV